MKFFNFFLFIATAQAFVPSNRVAHIGVCSACQSPRFETNSIASIPCINNEKRLRLYSTSTSTTADKESKSPTVAGSLLSASLLVVLDVAFRRLFQRLAISFPSSLAACCALFVSLLAFPFGQGVFNVLSPGAALLAKWLPVFFVPSLITLPLAGGVGSAAEVRDTIAHF